MVLDHKSRPKSQKKRSGGVCAVPIMKPVGLSTFLFVVYRN